MKKTIKKWSACKRNKKVSATLQMMNESRYLVYCLLFTLLAYFGFIWLLYR
ncbi:MAG: hypothetical protein ACFB0A_10130 [Croceivirga sp.]